LLLLRAGPIKRIGTEEEKMKVTWLGAGALAAALLGLPSPSQAGVRVGVGILVGHGYGYDNGYGWRHQDTYRVGYDRGFQDGLANGLTEAKRGERFDFWNDHAYRCGDVGYYRRLGSRGEYVSGYRGGYEVGYRKAYGSFGHRYERRYNGDERSRGYNRDYDGDDDNR
jgi:hypothetical protein